MKKFIILSFLSLFITNQTWTQISSPTELDVFLEIVDTENDSTIPPIDTSQLETDSLVLDSINMGTMDFAVKTIITVPDTSIALIHLKLLTNNQIITQPSIPFDPINLPNGLTYSREGNTIYIGLGTYSNLTTFQVECTLEDNQGNQSLTVIYDSNS